MASGGQGDMDAETAMLCLDGEYASLEVPSGVVRDGALISFI